jgi:hypothetical protein
MRRESILSLNENARIIIVKFNRQDTSSTTSANNGSRAISEPDVSLGRNLSNFMRTLALPMTVENWSLTSKREKLAKIGAKIVGHGRYATFQLAEVAIPKALFAEILRRIDGLRPAPLPP